MSHPAYLHDKGFPLLPQLVNKLLTLNVIKAEVAGRLDVSFSDIDKQKDGAVYNQTQRSKARVVQAYTLAPLTF